MRSRIPEATGGERNARSERTLNDSAQHFWLVVGQTQNQFSE